MAVPSLPAQGATDWYAWASGVDDAVRTGTAPTLANIPAGSVISVVQNGDGSWPNRPTSRTDVRVMFIRIVAGSSDPAIVTSPSVAGAYTNDVVIGA